MSKLSFSARQASIWIAIAVALFFVVTHLFSSTPEQKVRNFISECLQELSIEDSLPPLDRLFRARTARACFAESVRIQVGSRRDREPLRERSYTRALVEDRLKILFGRVEWISFRSDIREITFHATGEAQVSAELTVTWRERGELYRERYDVVVNLPLEEDDYVIEEINATRVGE